MIITKTIENYDDKKQVLCEVYKNCPLTGKDFHLCSKIDLHHLYSDELLLRRVVNHNKRLEEHRDTATLFVHSFINLLPVDHKAHINKLNVSKNSFSDKELYLMLEYLALNKDRLLRLNKFNGTSTQLIEDCLCVFEACDLKPVWFEKFF